MLKNIYRAFYACLWAGMMLLVTGCPPRTVIIEGREVTVEEAARLAGADAARAAKEGRTDEAITRYQKWLKDYSDTSRVDAALAGLGELLDRAGRHAEAVQVYQRLVSEHPESPHYLKAAVGLGLALVKLGRTQEALPTLQSVFSSLPDDKKKVQVARMLARSYEEAGALVEALRWYGQALQHISSPQDKEELKQTLTDLVDHRLSFVQVRSALEILTETGEKSFPLDLLQFKLAKIFFHIFDFERARKHLETFVADWPGHPLAKEAGQLLNKIRDRFQVQPGAVGVLLPLSGHYQEYGQKALAGIQLGAGLFDSPDKNKTAGPTLVIRDTGGDPERAVQEMERLVTEEHVIAVIGPMFSGEAWAAAVKAEELQVPIITLSGRKDITDVGPFVFRHFLTLQAQAQRLVAHAMDKLGAKKFACLYPNDKYGVEMVNAFWDEVKRRQGEMRAVERYEPDTKNFAAPIKRMVGRYWLDSRWDYNKERRRIYQEFKNNPLGKRRALEKLTKSIKPLIDFDAIFVPDYVDKVVLIAPALAFEDIVLFTDKQWQRERIKKSLGRRDLDMVYLLGGDGWNNPKVVEWAGRYVQGAIFTDGFFTSSTRPATRRFVTRFKSNFDQEPGMIEAHAHDTASILTRIVTQQHPQDRLALRQALIDLKQFDGATGLTSFAPNGEIQQEIFLLTVKNEEIVEVEPEKTDHAGS